MRVKVTVNGRRHQADDVWEGESLLYLLRERLGLPGSKNACEQGECGSCTVRLDGVPVCACLVAAGQAEGRDVVTVEGLADHARRRDGATPSDPGGTPLAQARRWTPREAGLSPVQQAFIDAGAVQCGFCTPGLLVAADELLERLPEPSDADIREALAGNLCRCTGYEKILDAVRLAAARRPAPASAPAPIRGGGPGGGTTGGTGGGTTGGTGGGTGPRGDGGAR
ncbi:(2Fe-2S)-binding protein [Streptomyces yaizuensis]|uniref:(2Fe-2S)-binding protein n=1 Tax=Streptomyces yaizuensis TaxID=2989713 RepID=A0ABQ5P5N8_9ACTN|nr:(2Fe-2S)-binding protein [Streptomyces sp. YSPA8]